MLQVSGYHAFCVTRQGRFEERFIALIRQPQVQRMIRHGFAFGSDLIQEDVNLLVIKLKFRPGKDLGIFRQDSSIEAE
jgi:hypothetical protein